MTIKYEGEIPVFRGSSRKGFGLAGTLRSGLLRYAIPLAKNFFSKYKDEIISTGKNIIRDVAIKKRPIKKAIKRRSRQTLKKILTGKGKGQKAIKRKTNHSSCPVPSKKSKKTHHVKKRSKPDSKHSKKINNKKKPKKSKKTNKTKDIFKK